MNAMAAMRQYQNVSTQAQAIDASPHRLIQMLMEGGLTRMAQPAEPWSAAKWR